LRDCCVARLRCKVALLLHYNVVLLLILFNKFEKLLRLDISMGPQKFDFKNPESRKGASDLDLMLDQYWDDDFDLILKYLKNDLSNAIVWFSGLSKSAARVALEVHIYEYIELIWRSILRKHDIDLNQRPNHQSHGHNPPTIHFDEGESSCSLRAESNAGSIMCRIRNDGMASIFFWYWCSTVKVASEEKARRTHDMPRVSL
jgi:hypothetical protein